MAIDLEILMRTAREASRGMSGLYVPLRPMDNNILYFTNNYNMIAHYVYLSPERIKKTRKKSKTSKTDEIEIKKQTKPYYQEKPYYVEDCSFDDDYISVPCSGLVSNPEQEAVKIANSSSVRNPTKGKIIDPRKERHNILENPVCRFCGKTKPEATFNKQAHAISEFTGDKTISLRNECDNCNELFSIYEADLSNFIGIASRTLSQTEGKQGIPVYKTDTTRLEVGNDRIVMQEVRGHETITTNRNTAIITTEKQPYIPLSAYKALVAMALSIIPENELKPFSETINWLLCKEGQEKQNEHFDRYAKKVLYRYIPGVKPLPVQAWILRHKSFLDVSSNHVSSNSIDCPYCHFILEFDNYSFQIVVPAIKKDALFKQPEIMMFPGTVDAAPEIAWNNVNNTIIDLSSPAKIVGEIQKISFHYDNAIPLDPKTLGSVEDVAKREGVKPIKPIGADIKKKRIGDKSNKNNITGNTIISNVIWKFAERILAQVVSLVVSIVLARLLLPNDYGAVAMVMVFIAIANIFVTEGLASALIQKKNADQLDFSSVFYANIILSLVIYAVLFCASEWIASFYKTPILKPVFQVLGLRIIVAAVNSVQHAYVARHMMFKKYFWATLFGTLLSGVVGIAMAYLGFGVWSLVAQYMVNTSVDTMVLFYTVSWRPTLQFSLSRVSELFFFGWKMLFEGVSNTIAGQIRNLIIGRVYTASDLAYYTKAQQFPSLIITNICVSIASVLFPAIANEQDDKQRVLLLLRRAIRVSSYTIYPLLVGLAMVATPFVSLILTDKWLDTVPYMQVYCFLNIPTVGMYLRHQALNGTGRSDVFMNEHIVARLLGFLILFLVYRISVLAIVFSSVCTSVIMTLIIAFTSKKYNGYTYHDQIVDVLPTLIGCTIMAVPVYFIQFLGLSSGLTLFLQIIVGTVVYILYSKIAHLEEYAICKEYACNVLGRVGCGVDNFKKEGVSN